MAEVSKCRSCKAAIIWAITEKGVRIPLDAEPNLKGNMTFDSVTVERDGHMVEENRSRAISPLLEPGVTRYMPHHATCPHGDHWRRSKSRQGR